MNRVIHQATDLFVLLGVLGLPVTAVTLGVMTVLGVVSPDDVVFATSAIVAISIFFLAVVLAHVFHPSA